MTPMKEGSRQKSNSKERIDLVPATREKIRQEVDRILKMQS
jgi:hypothetical protein